MAARRWLPICFMVGAVGGCTATKAVVLGESAGGSGPSLLGGTSIFVEGPGEGGERQGAFLPAEWREVWPEEESVAAEEDSIARRPVRRGGPGRRRPPPLLNPKPTPEQARYW